MRIPGKLKSRAGFGLMAAGLALAVSAADAHGAGNCGGDSARFRLLPPVIGRPGAAARIPYDLPCDSMIVPRGQTTTIHGSTVVNFGFGPGGRIVVQGKLVIEGKPGNPAYLAGSIANGVGFAPGDRPWIGIQADSGASLRISHARFYNASAALALATHDVILKNCFFQGTSALLLPDTSLELNPSGQGLSSLDLRDGRFAGSGDGKGGFGLARAGKWLAGGAGALAVSGAVWWWISRPDAKPRPASPSAGGAPDAAPDLPDPVSAAP